MDLETCTDDGEMAGLPSDLDSQCIMKICKGMADPAVGRHEGNDAPSA